MRSWRLVVALAVLAVLAAACSKSAAAKGPRAATGKPITVGSINMDDAPAGSFPEISAGVQAAVRYVNQELDGVGGRPIRLQSCTTDGSDASSQACASQLVAQHPVAVLGGIDLGTTGSMAVLEATGVPYVGLTPGLGDELTSTDSFMLSGGLPTELLGAVQYETDTMHDPKIGVVYQNLAGLSDAFVLAAQAILQQRGVTDLKIASTDANTAAVAAAVRTATVDHPDVLIAVFPSAGCRMVLDAIQAQKVKTHVVLPSTCLDQQLLDAEGAGAEGVTFATSLVPYSDTSDPQVATFLDRLGRYGPAGATPSALAEGGFALVVDLQRALDGLKPPSSGSVSGTKLADALRAARDAPAFLGHAYTCDGQAITILNAICSTPVRIVQVSGGSIHDVTTDWVDGAPLVKLLTDGPD